MFNQSDVLLYGGCIPALKVATVDSASVTLGAGLTLTELDRKLVELKPQLDGRETKRFNSSTQILLNMRITLQGRSNIFFSELFPLKM